MDSLEYLKSILPLSAATIKKCYNAGKDCAINGASTENSHFKYFSSPNYTKAWEMGKKDFLKDG